MQVRVWKENQLMFLICLMQLVTIDQVWSVPMIRTEHMYNRYIYMFYLSSQSSQSKKKEKKGKRV